MKVIKIAEHLAIFLFSWPKRCPLKTLTLLPQIISHSRFRKSRYLDEAREHGEDMSKNSITRKFEKKNPRQLRLAQISSTSRLKLKSTLAYNRVPPVFFSQLCVRFSTFSCSSRIPRRKARDAMLTGNGTLAQTWLLWL